MPSSRKEALSRIMRAAHKMMKRSGYTLSQALKVAWSLFKQNRCPLDWIEGMIVFDNCGHDLDDYRERGRSLWNRSI